MDTQKLNIAPDNNSSEPQSKKASKAKTVAGKAAQFAGAAAVGVAGTMAANAMNKDDDPNNSNDPNATAATASDQTTAPAEANSEAVEEPTEFNPNEIMIDPNEVLEAEVTEPTDEPEEPHESHEPHEPHEPHEVVDPNELQPITEETPEGTEIINVDIVDIEPDMYGGPVDPIIDDNWSLDNDNPDLLTDNGAELSEPDILSDILA